MRVLLLGATGFIGSELARALHAAGHQVTAFGRDPALAARLAGDFAFVRGDLRTMRDPADWRQPLAGIDAVVNASGTLQSGARDDVIAVQSTAIRALVAAAINARIAHFVQISAVNADTGALNPFMGSKAEADAALAGSGLSYTLLRPGLVIGRNAFGGTEMVRMAAGFPLFETRLSGTGIVQTVAMSDVIAAVCLALADPPRAQGSFDLVEAHGQPLDEVIDAHRYWLGFASPRWSTTVPVAALRLASLLADGLGWLGWRSPLRSNAMAALTSGISGDAAQGAALLGRTPMALDATLAALGPAGKADRWHARLALVYPVALFSLGLLWLVSGLLGLARTDEAAALLEMGGMDAGAARGVVLATSLFDIALAALLAWRPTASLALKAMLLAALGYLAGSTFLAPFLWADPLGPMLKVVPIAALIALCLAMVDER